MKKLLLVLALLLITSQGAFAAFIYPSCNNGGNNNNGTNKDRFNTRGWCIDDYGVLTPQTGYTPVTGYPNTQGGMAVPVINITSNNSTYDTLLAQNTGNYIIDTGGVANGTGSGREYILPASGKGEIFYFTVASKSTITIDTLTNTESIIMSPQIVVGHGIKNSSSTTSDTITLVSNSVGTWVASGIDGTWVDTGSARIH